MSIERQKGLSGGWLEGTALAALCLIALLRVWAVEGEFSATFDEPLHIAAGLQLWDQGAYTLEPLHPPLSRLAASFGPWAAGAHFPETAPQQRPDEPTQFRAIANEVFYADAEGRGGPGHEEILRLARMGVAPFLVILLLSGWALMRQIAGPAAALAGTAMLSLTPILLGHAGLATTDVPVTAMILLTLWRWQVCRADRSTANMLLYVGSFTLAVLTKFTALPWLLIILVGHWIWQRLLGEARPAAPSYGPATSRFWLARGLVLVLVWLAYGAGVPTLIPLIPPDMIPQSSGAVLRTLAGTAWLPDFLVQPLRGLAQVMILNNGGHAAYLLGTAKEGGFWPYYLVSLAVKLPLPLLLTGLGGLVGLLWCSWQQRRVALAIPAIGFFGILLFVTLFANINIGLRHILLPICLLALAGGWGLADLWQRHRFWGSATAALLAAWMVITSVSAHPNYFAWFNPLAGANPAQIQVDDLDWGQDLHRLEAELAAREIHQVAMLYPLMARLEHHDLPPFERVMPGTQHQGWVAISLGSLKKFPNHFRWLEDQPPAAYVGNSMILIYIQSDDD